MFGKVEKCIDPITGQEGKQAVTLSGPAEGIISKVAYCCDIDYNMVLENGGVGSGYVGLSTCCPITYNPWCCVGEDDEGNPIHKGVLTVDCLKAEEVEGSGCSELVYQHNFSNNLNYSVPIWGNAALIDNFGELGISDAYPLYYNPNTGTVTAKCYKADSTLYEEAGITFNCNCCFSIGDGCTARFLRITDTSVTNCVGSAGTVLNCNGLVYRDGYTTIGFDCSRCDSIICNQCVCFVLNCCSCSAANNCVDFYQAALCNGNGCTFPGKIANGGVCFQAQASAAWVCTGHCNYMKFGVSSTAATATCCNGGYSTTVRGSDITTYNKDASNRYRMFCTADGLFYYREADGCSWKQYDPTTGGVKGCVCNNTLYLTI